MITREIRSTEVQIFVLVLNTFGAVEDGEIVAISEDYNRLVSWYKDQFAEEVYTEGRWRKTFKKGSPIEFNNPCASLELNNNYPFGHGIHDTWIDINEFDTIKGMYNFV